MKRSSKEFKRLAREALIGNYGNFAVTYLIYFIIVFGIQIIPNVFFNDTSTRGMVITQIVTIMLSLIVSVLAVGLQKTALNIARKEPIQLGDLFYAFKHHPDKYIIVTFLMALIAVVFQVPTILLAIAMVFGKLSMDMAAFIILIIAVATIMLIISLILLLGYALTLILLIETPELGPIEAMQTSAQLMKGNKGRYFYLCISFLGLELLSLLTCGIAQFWVTPYMTTTYIEFYREVTGELDGGPRETAYTEYQSSNQDYWS